MAKSEAHRIYSELLREHGPQHWWPAESEFEVVVGALLTQNTNWRNAEKAIDNLREAKALGPEKLLSLKKRKLESLIRPSGFYRQKAERLRALTKKYLEIKKRGTPPSREELLEVKGVGEETADSILLYAFGLPYFVIDSYTKRFCAHHSLFKGKSYDGFRSFFESSLPKDVQIYKEYHALIVAWGKKNR
ncbi:MAG: endonuclease [Candidatus Micrarchaeota archaeon]